MAGSPSPSSASSGACWAWTRPPGEFDDIFRDIRHHRPFALALAVCVFELVLAVLLIWNPSANIEHHLILLGIELIVYPFKIHREQGRLKLEAEA